MQLRSAGLASVLCLTAMRNPCSAGEVTLDLIRALLKEHQTACHSLRVKYRHSQEAKTIGTGAQAFQIAGFEGVVWEWLQDGRKQCLRSAPQDLPDPTLDHPGSWASFDGQFGYEMHYWDRTPFVREIRKVRDKPQQLQHCRILAALGWQTGVDQESLNQCLELPGARLEGREEVHGVQCWKVRCEELTFRGVMGSGLIAWFDEEHGFLPRRWWISPLRAMRLPTGAKFVYQPQPGENYNSGEITEFQAVKDGVTGDSRWFPKLVLQETLVRGEMEVVDVAWNVPIPPQEFVPQPAEGAKWADYTQAQAGLPGPRYVGGAVGQKLYYERWRKSNLARGLTPPSMPGEGPPRPTIQPGQRLADANPATTFINHWTRIIVTTVGVILLFVAYWRWRAA